MKNTSLKKKEMGSTPEGELEVFTDSNNDHHIQCGRKERGQLWGESE